MSVFLAEVGRNLAARWFALLVPSGLLVLATAAAAAVLGQAHWYHVGALATELDRIAKRPAAHAPGTVVLAGIGILLAAAGLALLVQALSGTARSLWEGRWPAFLNALADRLTARRLQRWRRADDAYRTAVREKARLTATADSGTAVPDTSRLNAARNRIALVPPSSPTWIADRIRAVDRRVHTAYDLDLDSAWPRLWLLIPDTARAEIRAAHDAYEAGSRLMAWSPLYLLIAVWWWPSALIAAATALIGWRRGRSAMNAFSELVESTLDLYARDLAGALGIACPKTLTREVGLRMTRHLRKGS